jgi:hypothetical protein
MDRVWGAASEYAAIVDAKKAGRMVPAFSILMAPKTEGAETAHKPSVALAPGDCISRARQKPS